MRDNECQLSCENTWSPPPLHLSLSRVFFPSSCESAHLALWAVAYLARQQDKAKLVDLKRMLDSLLFSCRRWWQLMNIEALIDNMIRPIWWMQLQRQTEIISVFHIITNYYGSGCLLMWRYHCIWWILRMMTCALVWSFSRFLIRKVLILWTILCCTCSLRLTQAQGKQHLHQECLNVVDFFSQKFIEQAVLQLCLTSSVGERQLKMIYGKLE